MGTEAKVRKAAKRDSEVMLKLDPIDASQLRDAAKQTGIEPEELARIITERALDKAVRSAAIIEDRGSFH